MMYQMISPKQINYFYPLIEGNAEDIWNYGNECLNLLRRMLHYHYSVCCHESMCYQ